jgi:CheY-like chemotaxis protein
MGQRLRLLVVDHLVGARECFCELMRALGHSAAGAGSPDAALEELERGGFDVLVTHQELDDLVTGSLLIEEARRRGLLDGVHSVLLAARPVARLPTRTTQLNTPREAGRLEQLLASFVVQGHRPRAPSPTDPLRLVLYVRSATASSQRALALVAQALAEFSSDAVTLEIRDLSQDPDVPVDHDVALLPALVPAGAAHLPWLMGEFDSAAAVVRLLERAGLPRLGASPDARPPSSCPP